MVAFFHRVFWKSVTFEPFLAWKRDSKYFIFEGCNSFFKKILCRYKNATHLFQMSYRKLLLLRTWRTQWDTWRNKTTGLHEYTFNFKAWSLINDRWPHQQLLYTTLIFRAGLSRKEATVGGVRAPSPHAASCGIWASFLESTLHDAKVAYESLFSRCLCSSPSRISESLFSTFYFTF